MMIEKDVFMGSGYPKQYFELEALDEGIGYIPPTPIPTPTVNLPFEEEITLPVDNIPVPSPTIPPTPKVLPEDFIKLILEGKDVVGGDSKPQPNQPSAPTVPLFNSGLTPQQERLRKIKNVKKYAGVGLVAIFIGILIFKK